MKLRFYVALIGCATIFAAQNVHAALISRTYTYTAGNPITANENNTNENTLYTEINGNLDAANLAANSVDTSELKDASVTASKLATPLTVSSMTITEVTCSTLTATNLSFMTNWTAYTPTIIGFGTVTNVNFRWKRIGDTVYVMGIFAAGTVTGTAGSISLPGGYAPLYGANAHSSTQDLVGLWQSSKAELTFGSSDAGGITLSSPATTVAFARSGSAGVWGDTAANGVASSNGYVQVNFFFIHN